MRARLLLLLPILLSVTRLTAQCTQVHVPPGGLCGYVQKFSSIPPNFSAPTSSYVVSVCLLDAKGKEIHPCAAVNTENIPFQTPAQFWIDLSTQPGQGYHVYVYNDSEFYGSTVAPVFSGAFPTFTCNGTGQTCGIYMGFITAYPRPLFSPPVYPANHQTDTPLTFTLKWSDGSNPARSTLTIVYDLYAHGFGGPDLLEASNLSCNPDAQGNCQLAITAGLGPSEYWYFAGGRIHDSDRSQLARRLRNERLRTLPDRRVMRRRGFARHSDWG